MLLWRTKYLTRFLLKSLVIIGFILSFSIAASAQVYYNDVVGKYPKMSLFLFGAFRKPLKPNPFLSEYVKPSKNELMYWPHFPLTPAQVEARNREWERKNNRPFSEQIASDIIKNSVNALIYGRKPVATAPKF